MNYHNQSKPSASPNRRQNASNGNNVFKNVSNPKGVIKYSNELENNITK